jgi:ElaB/YqjD/DUF883 family membrane-anchored ribosome-binding protein
MAAETRQEEQAEMAAALDEGAEMFQQGMELGRVWARKAADGLSRWADKNPEQLVLVGLAAGFVLGKLLLTSSDD